MKKPPNSAPPRRRWYQLRVWVVLPALLVALLVWWRLIGRFRHPVGEGPAGPAVSAEPFRKAWREGPVLFLGIGDSMTEGYGARRGRGYFDLLARNDDAAHPDMKGRDLQTVFPRLDVLNLSVSYTTSAEHLERQVPAISAQSPDVFGVVVVTSGGNDLLHNYGMSRPRDGAMYGAGRAEARPMIENLRRRLEAILAGIQAKFPGGSATFLANVYDPTDGVGDIENAHPRLPAWTDGLGVLADVNTAIAAAARSRPGVRLVDIHRVFLGHGIHCRDRSNPHYRAVDPHYWYYENLEDPNERGYDALRRAFLLEMIERLGR